jgi:hypothetical protein
MSPLKSFVVRHAVGTLLVSAAGVTLLAGIAMAVVMAIAARPDWQAFRAASEIAVIVAIASATPVAACINRPTKVAVAGYFVSATVRFVGVVAGIIAAVHVGHSSLLPTVIMVMVYYTLLLVVESLVMGLALWNRSA